MCETASVRRVRQRWIRTKDPTHRPIDSCISIFHWHWQARCKETRKWRLAAPDLRWADEWLRGLWKFPDRRASILWFLSLRKSDSTMRRFALGCCDGIKSFSRNRQPSIPMTWAVRGTRNFLLQIRQRWPLIIRRFLYPVSVLKFDCPSSVDVLFRWEFPELVLRGAICEFNFMIIEASNKLIWLLNWLNLSIRVFLNRCNA